MAVTVHLAPAVTEADWQAVRAIRQAVFVEEQACPPDEEWDAADAPTRRGTSTHHLLARVDDAPAGCARWRPYDDGASREAGVANRQVRVANRPVGAAKLERFAVLAAFRGTGVGRALVARAVADATAAGHARLVLHAQAYLVGFYAGFGFCAVGARFWEAGIEHVKMERTTGPG